MSVGLGIEWDDGRYEAGNSIGQERAQRVARWATANRLPMLAEIDSNGLPEFTPASLDALIAEFEQLRRCDAAELPDAKAIADAFLPRLRELRGQSGWRLGDFG